MISINFNSAEQIATGMGNASDAIEGATGKSITTADQTTLTVNTKAQEANKEARKLAELFNQAFQNTIDNLRSVANEFEKTDQELNNNISALTGPIEVGEDMRTYTKAKNG